jgi:hypothetical protein
VTITDNETGISVAATDDSASEPADAGTFTLSRTGSMAGTLDVALSIGGTASAGDYVALPATVHFAADQTEAVVNVTPVDDFIKEPDKTVILTIEPGAGYLAIDTSAVITLHDDDTNLAPQITILSPAGGSAFIPQGPGIELQATVTDDNRPFETGPVVLSWSMVSGSGTVTFGDEAAAATTAVFSAPGRYLLRFSASDAELTATKDVSIFVMSDTLTGVNIGTNSELTGLAGGGSGWTLTGAGAGIGTTAADGFYFAHRQMSGDFTVIARVASINSGSASPFARCGVMVRSALTAEAMHAGMMVTPDRSSFVWRTAEGAAGAVSDTNQTGSLPRYVRLQRTGNSLTAAHSVDGIAWTVEGSAQSIAMPDPVYVGLAATGASTTGTVTAAFDAFSLTRAGNSGPFVRAGAPFTSGINALLEGSVTDDTGTPSIHWEKTAGPGSVTLPPMPSGNALFDTGGIYTLRLVADDGMVRTFDDTVVTVTRPFADWCQQHFGESAADPLVAGPRADPDQDGLENLAEYALSADPVHPDSDAAPVCSREGDILRMTWRESTAATDVVIEPQWSGDMITWESAGLTVETLSTGGNWVEKRAALDVSSLMRASLRLRVTMP